MKTQQGFITVLLVAAANLAASGQALASHPADVFTGKVTALPGGAQIVVDGKTYYLRVDGQALQQLQSVHVGESVDLVLDGPPNGTSTKVAAIREHVNQ